MDTQNKKTISIGFPFTPIKGGGPKIFLRRLKKSIRNQGIAKIKPWTSPFYDIGLFSSVARGYSFKPFVLRIDGIAFDIKNTCGLNSEINKPIFNSIKNASGLIFQSKFGKSLIEAFYGKIKTPNTIITNGIDIEEFNHVGNNKRSLCNIAPNDRVILSSASWRTHKRLKDIIEIFETLSNRSKSIKYHLIILGDVQNIPTSPFIHYPGCVHPDELPSWYRSGDIFLFLSWLDNCPNTVIEAISCGLPVVCSNQGGTKEIIEKTNGGIIVEADKSFNYQLVDLYNPPPPDQEKIIKSIEKVFNNISFFRHNIQRDKISIDYTAREYIEFIRFFI